MNGGLTTDTRAMLKLGEIAERIYAHLKRFETDPKINKVSKGPMRLHDYFCAVAVAAGSRIGVKYVGYHQYSFLTKKQAAAYLAWLDAGHVGFHWQAPQAKPEAEAK
jgi:hypothetical protein